MAKNRKQSLISELVAALVMLLDAHDALLPGLAHIAVENYALQNDAVLAARRAIDRAYKEAEGTI